jgi:hypothetical protein
MRKVLFFVAAAALYACASDETPTTPEPTVAIDAYGAEFDTTGAVSFAAANFEGGAEGVYRATIVESCQKMGCWMKVEHPAQGEVMVFMNDHNFFVPKTGVNGLTCYMTGQAYYDTTTVDLQKHLLEDAMASQEEIDAITEDKFELQFNAMGVVILGYAGSEEAEESHDGHDHEHGEHDHGDQSEAEGATLEDTAETQN